MDVNKIRQLSINMNSNHVLREAYQTGAAAYGPAEHFSDNSQLYFQLGGDFPRVRSHFRLLFAGKLQEFCTPISMKNYLKVRILFNF